MIEKETTEELNPQEEVKTTEEETTEEETTEEETTEEETPSEEESTEEETEEETPSKEDIELFKSARQEVGEKRFDGLMSSWQEDRRERLKLESKSTIETPETTPEGKAKNEQEGKWFDYIYSELKKKESAERKAEGEAANEELKEAMVRYPELKKEQILDIAIKYSTNLFTAGQIATDIKQGKTTSETISDTERERKQKGSKIGGKPSPQPKEILTKYDSKLSLQDNIEKGMKELGI